MPGMPPGPAGKKEDSASVKGKTAPLIVTPPPGATGIEYVKGKGISFELQDAPAACVPTTLNKISYDEMRVLYWLRNYRAQIIAAEAEFQVDRRAIAAAIAWEALQNVWSHSVHAVGPGKPHLWRSDTYLELLISPGAWLASITDEGTWAKQVEDAHILCSRSYSERKKLLQTPEGAIQYIGAIMDLIATIYEENGSPGTCNPTIRLNPVILTNEYQGSDAKKWTARMRTIKPGELLTGPKNDSEAKSIAVWINNPRNRQYIEDAVGSPELDDSPQKSADTCTSEYRDATAQESAKVLEKAKAYEDAPYKYGGSSTLGIDCSHHVWKAITDAFPSAKYEYMATDGLASVPWLRKLKTDETPVSGDVILFDHHVGFYDQNPPADKPGQILFSARGDQTRPTPGVTWGKPEWFGAKSTFLRVRIPCK